MRGGAIARVALSRLDWLLQLILPVADRRVCYFSKPDFTDNAYHVYCHLLRTRSGLEHVWLVEDSTVSGRLRREFEQLNVAAGATGHTLRVVERRSLAGYFLHLTSRYLFYTERIYTPSARYRGRRVAVSLWHGMPIKDIARLGRNPAKWSRTTGHLHIASSRFFKHIIASSFDADPDTVLVCLSPRCDALHFADARALPGAEIRNRLKVPAGRKLIVWLPTFRSEPGTDARRSGLRSFLDDLPDWALPQLNRYCEVHGATVLLKLHKVDALNHKSDIEVGNVQLLRSAEWARHGIQLYDLLAAADGLISDVSSVLIDYIPTGKPIGLLGFDEATYPRELTFSYQHLRDSRRFHDMKDLAAVEAFVRAVADGAPADYPPNDIARMLHDDFCERGAEAVAAHVGL